MAVKTFEYCSFEYLDQWLAHDRHYCNALAYGNKYEKISALKRAGGFYKVARNLPLEFDEKQGLERYEPVLNIIDPLEPTYFEGNTVNSILNIENLISRQYGNRRVISLTTKFLWLKIRQPIIVYDSQARIALGTKDGDLDAYYYEWHKEFKNNQIAIAAACLKLPDMDKVSGETWFHERVFDNYLWNKGSKG